MRKSSLVLGAGKMPKYGISPETTPIKHTSYMLGSHAKGQHEWWWNNRLGEHDELYRERSKSDTWPAKTEGWEKGDEPVLHRWYSPEALKEAVDMIPPWFHAGDVPRPPQRIKAQSEGIVGRWYTNYWTLHSVKFQCKLAKVPWHAGDRIRTRSNYDEPHFYVDYDESKMIRDHRSRWINIHRSMADGTKKVMLYEEEQRVKGHKKSQDLYWNQRKVLINRLKAMQNTGAVDRDEGIAVARHFNFDLLKEE